MLCVAHHIFCDSYLLQLAFLLGGSSFSAWVHPGSCHRYRCDNVLRTDPCTMARLRHLVLQIHPTLVRLGLDPAIMLAHEGGVLHAVVRRWMATSRSIRAMSQHIVASRQHDHVADLARSSQSTTTGKSSIGTTPKKQLGQTPTCAHRRNARTP